MEVDYTLIRPEIIESLRRYADNRIPTGDFLRAVLENNLKEAFGRADDANIVNLFHIIAYTYNNLPSVCWGSKEKVRKWIEHEE